MKGFLEYKFDHRHWNSSYSKVWLFLPVLDLAVSTLVFV